MGGTTAWLASRLPRQAHLTSIEHDPLWFTQVRNQVGVRENCDLRLRPSSTAAGRNATIEEEDTNGLTDYIQGGGEDLYDIILVDGVARNACLEQAARLVAPGGLVFLHDAQRPWYDSGKRHLREVEVVGACQDYPPPWLWVGTSQPRALDEAGAAPVIVSFFTEGTAYESLARRLQEDCRVLGLDAVIESVPSTGSWARNTSLKAEFCRRQWRTRGRPLLWVDVDARIWTRPSLDALGTADVGVHKWAGWQIATGTMFFNQTEHAGSFLDCWCMLCERQPDLPDQIAADLAWESVSSRLPLRTVWLPQTFCHIFDSAAPEGSVVIEHFQASRRLKAAVSRAAPPPYPESTPLLRACRMTSRPRRWVLSHHDSADALAELTAETEDELPARFAADEDEAAWLCTIQKSLDAQGTLVLRDRLLQAGRALAASHARYVVYGSGAVGRELAAACRRHGTPPVAFVESRVTATATATCDSLPVWTPEQARSQGIRVFLLGTLASGEAMRARLEATFRDAPAPRIEPASDSAQVRATDARTRALLHEGLESVAGGRTLSEHAWLCGRRGHLVDASIRITSAVERLLHIDRYRFVATHGGGRSVLDLTAGSGDGSRWLASHGYARRVAALVADDKALAYAQRHHAHVNVEYTVWGRGTLEQIPGGSVQLALLLTPAPDAPVALLESVHRCLTDDGCYVASLPAAALRCTSPTAAAASLDVLRDHFADVAMHAQWQASSERPGRIEPVSAAGDILPDILLAVCRRPRRPDQASGGG